MAYKSIHGMGENVIYAKSICSREKLTLQSCPAIKRHCRVIQERSDNQNSI